MRSTAGTGWCASSMTAVLKSTPTLSSAQSGRLLSAERMLSSPAATEARKIGAMLASLIESCKLHGVNPEAYLTDVLTKLVNNWPDSRLADLSGRLRSIGCTRSRLGAGLPRTDRRRQTKLARQAVQIVATAHRLRLID